MFSTYPGQHVQRCELQCIPLPHSTWQGNTFLLRCNFMTGMQPGNTDRWADRQRSHEQGRVRANIPGQSLGFRQQCRRLRAPYRPCPKDRPQTSCSCLCALYTSGSSCRGLYPAAAHPCLHPLPAGSIKLMGTHFRVLLRRCGTVQWIVAQNRIVRHDTA